MHSFSLVYYCAKLEKVLRATCLEYSSYKLIRLYSQSGSLVEKLTNLLNKS